MGRLQRRCWELHREWRYVFFAGRRRHARLTCDWSSDVCSSDLDPVALLAAAVEAYTADHAAVETAFHAGARRGRPEVPDRMGAKVQLRYAGTAYELFVYRTSPGSYRVRCGNVAADLSVQVLNAYERRV